MRGPIVRYLPAVIASLFGLTCGYIAVGGEIYLGFDQFHYVQMARFLYMGEFQNVTTVWPMGFPLLSLPLQLLHAKPATALVLVNCLAFVLLAFQTNRLLTDLGCGTPRRTVLLALLLGSPIWPYLVYTPMSEVTFTVTVLVIAHGILVLPERKGTVLIVIGSILAFTVRYIGIVFAPVLPLFLLLKRRQFNRQQRNAALLGSIALVFFIGGMVLLNYLRTGLFTGDYREITGFHLFEHMADFGTAFLGMFGQNTSGYLNASLILIVGTVLFVALVVLCLYHLKSGGIQSIFGRVSLLILAYSVGFIVVRTFFFTDIDAPRRIVPILPFVLCLAVPLIASVPRAVLYALAGLAVVFILIQTSRHAACSDPLIPIIAAEDRLQDMVQPGDVLVTNYDGKSILRSVNADVRFDWAHTPFDELLADARYVLLVPSYDPADRTYKFKDPWKGMYETNSVGDTAFFLLEKSPFFILFKRHQH